MDFKSINLIISLLFSSLLILLGIFIQVKLSKNKNKYLGFILPVLFLLFSIGLIYVIINGTILIESTADYLGLSFTFLISNIPTILLLAIYLRVRNKIQKQS